jgi:hypothetical protein
MRGLRLARERRQGGRSRGYDGTAEIWLIVLGERKTSPSRPPRPELGDEAESEGGCCEKG